MKYGGLSLLLICCLLTMRPEAALSIDSFYLWQRQWTPAVKAALNAEDPHEHLFYWAGEMERSRNVCFAGNAKTLKRFARRTAVIRIHVDFLKQPLPQLAQNVVEMYRKSAGGGLQLDVDAPESKLGYYAGLLKEVQKILRPDTELSATVLPCHVRHQHEFAELAAACDYFVLQVHGTDWSEWPPKLIDRNVALNAMKTASQYGRRFLLALPGYAYRATRRKSDGQLIGVSAEQGRPPRRSDWETVWCEPDWTVVTECVARARKTGIEVIWFRLPVAGDELSLSRTELSRLAAGKTPEKKLLFCWKKQANDAILLEVESCGFAGGRPVTIRLKYASGNMPADSDTLAGFQLMHTQTGEKLIGESPVPGKKINIYWARPRKNWLAPELEYEWK